jgi:hypothetical protein
MELLLNAIWLVISAAPIAWWVRTHSFASRRREFCLGVGAMLCVGMLLFPPISVSDDLHNDVFAAEDANSSKKMLVGGTHARASFPCAVPPVAPVAAFLGMFCPTQSYPVLSFTLASNSSQFVRLLPGRAPPAV